MIFKALLCGNALLIGSLISCSALRDGGAGGIRVTSLMSLNENMVSSYNSDLIEEIDTPSGASAFKLKDGTPESTEANMATLEIAICGGDAEDYWLFDEIDQENKNQIDGDSGGLLYDIGVTASAEEIAYSVENLFFEDVQALEPIKGKCFHMRVKYITDGVATPDYWGLTYLKHEHNEGITAIKTDIERGNLPEIEIPDDLLQQAKDYFDFDPLASDLVGPQ